jgi:hypothetical protein
MVATKIFINGLQKFKKIPIWFFFQKNIFGISTNQDTLLVSHVEELRENKKRNVHVPTHIENKKKG